MEHGKLSRDTFMAEIAAMTERMVKKAKEYDRDTIPGDYATLQTPCPNCGGIVKENYRRYTCTGKSGNEDGCGFSFGKTPGGRTFELAEVEQFLRDRKIGPLEGFRSKAGWPFTDRLRSPGIAGCLPQVRQRGVRAWQELCLRKVSAHSFSDHPQL
jgi:DNA topoisomerase-3